MSIQPFQRGQHRPLAGVDEISIPANAVIKFTYPELDDLYIHSGATSIKWSYQLNTNSTPTIGGEVVQILSAMVGPITISGQTAGLKTNKTGNLGRKHTPGWLDGKDGTVPYSPYFELRDIVEWFRKYMRLAGTDNAGVYRDERAIYFEYPERDWNFRIMPTAIKGFRYDKSVIAPEWSITAEVVSNNALDYFSGVTMSSFTDDLLTTNTQLQGQIGLSRFGATGTETANPNFGQTGDYGSGNPFLNPEIGISALAEVRRMGDNFQGLVAAWSQGDFAHFGFGAMLDNNALPKNVDAVFQQLFGNTPLGSLPGWGGSGGGGGGSGGGTYTYNGSNKHDGVAAQIANAFIAKKVPPELGIAVAWHESGLNPDQTQWGCFQSDCGIGLFQVNGNGTGEVGSHKAQIVQAGKQRTYSSAKGSIVQIYTEAMQVSDAAEYFKANQPGDINSIDNLGDDKLAEWAFAAQKGKGYLTGVSLGTCTPLFSQDLAKAREILNKQLTNSGSGGGGLRASVLAWVAKANSKGNIPYNQGCDRQAENYPPGSWPHSLDCSAYAGLMYCWGTNNNHRYATNGHTFNGTTTVTISETWKNNRVPASKARAGDLVQWEGGDFGFNHVMILMEDWNGGSTKLSGLEKPSIPGATVVTFADENPIHVAHGNTSYFYSILP